MNTKTLYFDESGFTGYNFLDPNQPIFSVASTDIPPSPAESILKTSFPDYKGEEFKFSNIWNSRQSRNLTRFAENFKNSEGNAFIYNVDKEFCVLLKIVDFLIEPFYTNAGYNFYADGFCWKYANYIFFGLTHIDPEKLLPEIMGKYQTFSRNPTPQSLLVLRDELEKLIDRTSDETKVILCQMKKGAEYFNHFNDIENFKSTNDIQLSAMLASVAHWRQNCEEDLIVVHDNASNFSRQRNVWSKITSPTAAKHLHPLGDGSFVQYPLRVANTIAEDSKTNYSIQLCDILAGISAKHAGISLSESERELMMNIMNSGLGHIPSIGLSFQPIFPDFNPPRRLDGPDVIDMTTSIIFG
jgi:hypothetical protein